MRELATHNLKVWHNWHHFPLPSCDSCPCPLEGCSSGRAPGQHWFPSRFVERNAVNVGQLYLRPTGRGSDRRREERKRE